MEREAEARLLSRRGFLQTLGWFAVLADFPSLALPGKRQAYFTIVNHWHHSGVGFFLRQGQVAGKTYDQAFSMFYTVQKTIDALEKWPSLRVCLEFDSYAYEEMLKEDPEFVRKKMQKYVDTGRLDIVGGTYTQPYSQLYGWQANVRQLVEGRAAGRRIFGKEIDCFLVEEIIFHPQMPQLLRRSGFRYASLQCQNNGRNRVIKKSIVNWRGLDGSEIPTVPQNELMISLTKQYQRYDDEISQGAAFDRPLFTLWAEIWPPGFDWGASYLPYAQGIGGFAEKGVQPVGLTEYMRQQCPPGAQFDSEYMKMDDAIFFFGWPKNKGSGWETIGGWGYEGDVLLIKNRELESSLHAAELLVSLTSRPTLQAQISDLWKKFMVTQQHDFFIVTGYPAEYNQVYATNLAAALMIFREVEAGIAKVREMALSQLTGKKDSGEGEFLLCQNPSNVPATMPVVFEREAAEGTSYVLYDGATKVEVQKLEPAYQNEKPKFAVVVSLPPFGFKSFTLRKTKSVKAPIAESAGIDNGAYSVEWDSAQKAFSIRDREANRTILFRPFAGDIERVKESFWFAPNTGEDFRAKNFGEVSYRGRVEAAGPVCQSLRVTGNVLTLKTSEYPAARVVARAVLFRGIKRVDIFSELHTYPQMGFLAFAEVEAGREEPRMFRDFPFGEEETHNEEFSALHYVRVETPGGAVLLAHSGHQQFFNVKRENRSVLRNMIARLTLKGAYRWRWALTTGPAFTPAECYRFAETLWGPVLDQATAPLLYSQSPVSVDDPAVVIFRWAQERGRATVWLANYSDQERKARLDFSCPYRSSHRTDFEGKRIAERPPVLRGQGKRVEIDLSPWEITALELTSAPVAPQAATYRE